MHEVLGTPRQGLRGLKGARSLAGVLFGLREARRVPLQPLGDPARGVPEHLVHRRLQKLDDGAVLYLEPAVLRQEELLDDAGVRGRLWASITLTSDSSCCRSAPRSPPRSAGSRRSAAWDRVARGVQDVDGVAIGTLNPLRL